MAMITLYRKELKGKILKTAMEQFMLRGIKSVKMDDIARQLGISKRTLYEIYQDKEELLYEGLKETEEYIDNYLKRYAETGQHNVVEVMMESYYIQAGFFTKINPAFLLEMPKYDKVVKLMAARRKERDRETKAFFKQGIKEGLFRSDVNFEVIASIGHFTMKHILETKMYRDYTFETLFETVFLVLVRGMCTEEGIRIVDASLRSGHHDPKLG